jgi:hypothetical protein
MVIKTTRKPRPGFARYILSIINGHSKLMETFIMAFGLSKLVW